MAADNFKSKARSGFYWSAASNIANKGLQFIFSIILARLLLPNDYGIIGILTIFITIIQLFVDSGFSNAIITKQERTQTDLSTAFYFNVFVGIIGYAILFFTSPYIADFYDMPILSPILKVIGMGVIINSLNIVQVAHYAIQLNFKTPAIISISCQIVTGIVGIALAYRGFGVWSLVFQQVTGGVMNLVLNWFCVKWRPSLVFSFSSVKMLWNYGSRVLGSALISTTYDNIQPLIIGKCFSASELGLFTRAQGFATLPSSNLSGILAKVTFPLLSKINNDLERLATVYRRLLRVAAFIVFPAMIGLAVLSAPLVQFLLPERWYGCIPLLQIICFSLMWQPISLVNLSLLNAAKRPDVVLKLELIKKPLGLLLLFSSIPFGIIVMCYANLFVCVFAVIVNTVMTSQTLKVSFWQQVKDLVPILLYALLMGVVVYVATFWLSSNLLRLIIGTVAGVLIYYVLARLFMKDFFQDMLFMIKRKA